MLINHQDRPSTGVRRILVRGTNWLGDAVMTLAALRRLRAAFPEAHICLLTSPGTAGLFESSPVINETIIYHRKERGPVEFIATIRRLRQLRFDLAILFQNAFEAALLALLAGIPHRVGYAVQGRSRLLTIPVGRPQFRLPRHQVYDYLNLVEVAAQSLSNIAAQTFAHTISEMSSVLRPSAAQQKAAADLMRSNGISTDSSPIVVLNVAATNSRAKCWPEDRYAALANELTSKFRAQILLIGAQSERAIAERVLEQIKSPRVANFAGLTNIPTLIGLLSYADLIISNDTGPAHIAAALGRPTLTIFGPTNEFETAPIGPRAEIIRTEGIACARCMLRDCPIDHRCMREISVDDLIKRARPFFDSFKVESGSQL